MSISRWPLMAFLGMTLAACAATTTPGTPDGTTGTDTGVVTGGGGGGGVVVDPNGTITDGTGVPVGATVPSVVPSSAVIQPTLPNATTTPFTPSGPATGGTLPEPSIGPIASPMPVSTFAPTTGTTF